MSNKEVKTSKNDPSTPASSGLKVGVAKDARKVSKRPLYVVGAILLAVIASLVALNGNVPWNKTLAEADGHKIHKSDVQELIKNSKQATQYGGATVLADKYLTEAMGKEQNVTISEQDAKAEYPTISALKKSDPYAYQNIMNQVYFSKLRSQFNGTYQGKLVVAHFSRNVAYDSPLLAQRKAKNPNLGNATAIAADKKYAQDFITSMYDQIKSGEITFDQAIAAERANPVVGEGAYATLGHSGPFKGTLRENDLIDADSIRTRIQQLKPGELTKPFVVRVNNSMYDSSTVESYWLMVQLDRKSGGGQSGSFEESLSKAKKELGYKVYVQNKR